jgi:hypothetical protein
MKDIITNDYEVKNRRRIKLADGKWGWIGILQQAYESNCFVVGYGKAFSVIRSAAPLTWDEAKEQAKMVTSHEI